jgi:Ca-activated chloride channel family protein
MGNTPLMVSTRGEVMTLLNPLFLWLLLPLLIVVRWYRPTTLQPTIHFIVLVLLVIAMARPVVTLSPQKSAIKSRNIVIAVDISYSMRATDITPSRYLFAKETIKSLLHLTYNDTVTLIAFTSNPLLLSPPTTDHRLIVTALEQLNLEYILTKGTSIERLLALVQQFSGEKSLILMTDGGEESTTVPLIPYLKNTSVHILALGSTRGSTIQTEEGRLLKDSNQNLVVSRINPMLKRLANQVDGSYHEVEGSPKTTANALLAQLHTPKQLIEREQKSYKEYYMYPLGLALLLFFLHHTYFRKYLLLLFVAVGLPLQASSLSIGFDTVVLHHAYSAYKTEQYKEVLHKLHAIENPTLESQLLLANTYYQLGEYEKAKPIYLSLKSDQKRIQQMLYYNLGNLHTKQHQYTQAKRYYALTLQLGEDADARFNLNQIALLKDRKFTSGIQNPASSSSTPSSNTSQNQESQKSSEGSKSGGSSGSEKSASKSEIDRLKLTPHHEKSRQQLPISSKVYDVINEGYIYEKTPW